MVKQNKIGSPFLLHNCELWSERELFSPFIPGSVLKGSLRYRVEGLSRELASTEELSREDKSQTRLYVNLMSVDKIKKIFEDCKKQTRKFSERVLSNTYVSSQGWYSWPKRIIVTRFHSVPVYC
ncbi:RAMP superfamily CRISPR-associated protein [Shouchella rhizosphaerae]|uniref:RAMP superfamily CRISPR-associated protein n=1 Tax=Shouchella rhizosphaerae TaxID=866786 RepID=UPI003F7FB0CC